ncbi:MAG: M14-type cytosolic carboxypeptidase, partial [Pseudoalteromonas prydzensis]
MKITSNFDSGNIKVIAATDPLDIQLEINKDHLSDFFQWFH